MLGVDVSVRHRIAGGKVFGMRFPRVEMISFTCTFFGGEWRCRERAARPSPSDRGLLRPPDLHSFASLQEPWFLRSFVKKLGHLLAAHDLSFLHVSYFFLHCHGYSLDIPMSEPVEYFVPVHGQLENHGHTDQSEREIHIDFQVSQNGPSLDNIFTYFLDARCCW